MITKPNDGLLFWLFITCIEVTEDWNTTLTNSVGVDSATRWHRSESCFRLCWGVASYKSRDSSLMCLWISTPALSKFTSSYLGIITIKYVCVFIDWSCCVSFINSIDLSVTTSVFITTCYHTRCNTSDLCCLFF